MQKCLELYTKRSAPVFLRLALAGHDDGGSAALGDGEAPRAAVTVVAPAALDEAGGRAEFSIEVTQSAVGYRTQDDMSKTGLTRVGIDACCRPATQQFQGHP